MVKGIFFAAGSFFLVLLGVWQAVFVDKLTVRIAEDWGFHAQYLGNLVYADDEGRIPRKKRLNLYQRDLEVVDWEPDRAVIRDRFTTIDVQNGNITWESTLDFTVDPVSAKIIHYENHPEATGLSYLFPAMAEQKDYHFFGYDLNPYVMRFHRQESRENVSLNVYRFQGRFDYTELYKHSYAEDGHRLLNTDERLISFDFFREYWVEPVSGEIVHVIENDPGDYLVDATSGERLGIFAVWSGKFTGETLKYLLQRAKKRLWLDRLYRWWVPGFLTVNALFFLGGGIFFLRREKGGGSP